MAGEGGSGNKGGVLAVRSAPTSGRPPGLNGGPFLLLLLLLLELLLRQGLLLLLSLPLVLPLPLLLVLPALMVEIASP